MNDCKDVLAKMFPFWDKLNKDEREIILNSTTKVKYKSGENIHGRNNNCTGVIAVASGCIRAYILSEEGREVTLYRLYPGEVCILSASCVLKSITFDVFVDAEEDTECFILSAGVFSEVSEKNLYVKNFALETASARFSDVMWVMQQILFMSFDKRLALFLWDETEKSGKNEVHMTHEQIAKLMGSAREVVSRMLKYFASEGIVENLRGSVKIINKEKLRKLTV